MFIGKKVILRSLELSDLDYIVKHDNNLDLRHNLGTAVPRSRQESENWIRESWEKRKIEERFVFAFTNKETSEFIGVVNLYIIKKPLGLQHSVFGSMKRKIEVKDMEQMLWNSF